MTTPVHGASAGRVAITRRISRRGLKGNPAMTAQADTATAPEPDQIVEKKIQQLRELYDDAPELGRVALENGLSALKGELAAATRAQSAGRIGARQGRVSELTLILPFADGGAK